LPELKLKIPNKGINDTFEDILNEIEVTSIPIKFVSEVNINLKTGQVLRIQQDVLNQLNYTEEIFDHPNIRHIEDDIIDIEIYLNIEILRSTVAKTVKKLLKNV